MSANFVRRKAIDRRTLLRGLGGAAALPLLDAMLPAATRLDRPPFAPVKRIGYVYLPMGCDHSRWIPKGETLEQLPFILEPLAPVRDKVNVIGNLEVANAYPGSHATSNSAFLSCALARHTESSDYRLATTTDQLAARRIGGDTRLPSLELAMDLLQLAGQCDNGYACVYQNNLSWSSPTNPLPAEAHPRLVFESLFGTGGTAAERRSDRRRRASLLDTMKEDIARLAREVGPADRERIAGYLESIREVERRIQRAERSAAAAPPDATRPLGVPRSFREHARLMFDLQVLALQGDVTRVITFQLARETSNRSYPEIGVPESHHPLTHHGNNPKKIEQMAKINRFHVSLFAEFVAKLAATADGPGALLDHAVYLLGSGMGNPNIHDHTDLPILVAGGGLRGGRHLREAKVTPLANLHLTLLDQVGVRLPSFADSTGRYEPLTR